MFALLLVPRGQMFLPCAGMQAYKEFKHDIIVYEGAGMIQNTRKTKRSAVKYEWNKDHIRALRQHLGKTQREMAEELEVRQQTISEWETGMHQPHRSTKKILSLLAERAEFAYDTRAYVTDGGAIDGHQG